MGCKIAGRGKELLAHTALVRFLTTVCPLMAGKMCRLSEAFLALSALVRSLTTVQPSVTYQGRQFCKTSRTFAAFVWLSRPCELANANRDARNEQKLSRITCIRTVSHRYAVSCARLGR